LGNIAHRNRDLLRDAGGRTTAQGNRYELLGVDTCDTFTGRVDDIAANIGRLQRGEPLRNVIAR
jgi:hypothetical protein